MSAFFVIILIAVTVGLGAPGLVAGSIISLAGFAVGVAAMTFDTALTYFVTDFHELIYRPIAAVVGNTIWTAFRDIANIFIIGIFTFMAISTILGIERFNARKLLAKVLIVAVLINFSLLFTNSVIMASNFFATKFHQSMNFNTAGGGANRTDFAGSSGIAGQFMNLMGLPSLLDGSKVANRVWDANASSWSRALSTLTGNWFSISPTGSAMAITYGVTISILLLALSLVLLYAVFLLTTRTVLLLFLLMTSAVAFAAFLWPGSGDRYFKMWWESLLRNAALAPLLLLLLWTTLTLSFALTRTPSGQNRSFEMLFTDPSSGSGVAALLYFALILGMLIASVRAAQMFSQKISGFGMASIAALAPVGLAGRLTGSVGRRTVGLGADLAGKKLEAQAKNQNRGMASRNLFSFGSDQLKKVAKSDMNFARSQLAKTFEKTTGLGVTRAAGTAPKRTGYAGQYQDKVDRKVAQAEKLALSPEEQQKINGERMAGAMKDALEKRPDIKEGRDRSSEEIVAARRVVEQATKEQQKMVEQFSSTMKSMTDKLTAIQNQPAGTQTDKANRQKQIEEHTREIEREKSRHKDELMTQTERIKGAHKTIAQHTKNIENLEKELKDFTEMAGKVPARVETAADIGARLARQRPGTLFARMAETVEKDDALAKAVRISMEKKQKDKNIRDQMKQWKMLVDERTPEPARPLLRHDHA